MGYSVQGKTVLITGAAMGMGRIYADLAADEGAANVVLWDIDASGLAKAEAELVGKGARVLAQVVDVADLEAIEKAATQVRADFGHPDVLINNAGVVRSKYFWENDPTRDIKFVMDINALAPMYITREFLPAMVEDTSRECRIVNIASAAGTVSNPKMAVYAASKWAALGWSDSVRLELEQAGHKHVKVTTICPSYISTGMFEGAKGPLLAPILTPEQVTSEVWKEMKKGSAIVLMPKTVYLSRAAKGILPTRVFDFLADHVLGVYHTMDEFTGRGTPSSSR